MLSDILDKSGFQKSKCSRKLSGWWLLVQYN